MHVSIIRRQENGVFQKFHYTSINSAQYLMEGLFKVTDKPLFVLIDELDRCDPGEAFDVIKQLRIFFSMRNMKIIFVLSANPEPIGLAIKHQYGLSTKANDYEAKRILEKFVDFYIDLSDPMPLSDFVSSIWADRNGTLNRINFINDIDLANSQPDFEYDTVKQSLMMNALSTSNYLYSNLRVLHKSYQYVTKHRSITPLAWTAWHLEILRQMHSDLLADVQMLAPEIGGIAFNSHVRVVRQLFGSTQSDYDNLIVDEAILLESEKGKTAFSIYRSWFWDLAKDQAKRLSRQDSSEARERHFIMERFLANRHIMDFIILMSLVIFSNEKVAIKNLAINTTDGQYIENWRDYNTFKHFSWLVANY